MQMRGVKRRDYSRGRVQDISSEGDGFSLAPETRQARKHNALIMIR